ncbi:hypothetical protein [Devosia sp. SL43]|uniref:hypothetical protein n=1 Tax=Devosia sp. SL43 TaxID=2806348 RepID=UPI001F298385|nr:hypothetical protein [Devosia sp. SL43]UJW85388.1 hypothetical protein IM737_18640 [Devosia sp. SL43]
MTANRFGLYLICIVITLTILLFAAMPLILHFSSPIGAEAAASIARTRMEQRFVSASSEERSTDCIVEDYPDGTFQDNQAFEVTCSVVRGSKLVARTTYTFGRDGLAGHEDWDVTKI